ncbi:MAG: helix-turn-helix domain-containing protein [Bacteroidales bacterium]
MKKIETFCPIRDILSKIGDKWSVLVLLLLEQNEVLRFSEIARQIPDVSQKMLTVTLRSLEALNLVERKIYPEVPPRVEYSLSPLGKSLLPKVRALVEWALENREACLSKG